MSRNNDEDLRACPTCATPVASTTHLGLRDYTWLNHQLPGKVGLTDGDGFLERRGHILQLEFKPKGTGLPQGQRIFLKSMVKKGIYVWVVWGDGPVEVGQLNARGDIEDVEELSLEEFIEAVMDWWHDADEGLL